MEDWEWEKETQLRAIHIWIDVVTGQEEYDRDYVQGCSGEEEEEDRGETEIKEWTETVVST